jgi:hypothetical protein
MSTDGDNIVRGRIRRWIAVHGNPSKQCEQEKRIAPATLNEDDTILIKNGINSASNGDVVIQNGDG